MKLIKYFNLTEKIIWLLSIIIILIPFLIFDRNGYLSLIASILGVTSLLFCAKGNFIGQIIVIIFSIMYAIIAFNNKYYGEVITYLTMTMPFAVVNLITWIKNPGSSKTEVEINKVRKKDFLIVIPLMILVTSIFYFILKATNTNNLIISTVSIASSFFAMYFTFRRTTLYALGYALNDIVLIILWTLGTINNIECVSILCCFIAFFINDIYGFIAWHKRMKNKAS